MDTPNYVRLEGKGIFSHQDFSFESPFAVLRNPWWTGILAGDEDPTEALKSFALQPGTWQLTGSLKDGRHVEAESLIQTGIHQGPHSFEFSALTEVCLGTQIEDSPIQSLFPLVGYFESPFSLHHNEWEIAAKGDDQMENAKELAKRWRLPIEGMHLKLVHPGACTSEHMEMARSVMTLTSLAAGTGVSSHRHIFIWKTGQLETWRHMTGDEPGPGPIVPSFEMTTYLKSALAHFEALEPERRSALRLAVDYINLSANGYLDTRLFHITQPWEFLAKTWNQEGMLSEDILCLRSTLKRVINEWRQDHVDIDPYGFWASRVFSVFNWPKLKDQIEQLARIFGLNLGLLGLDLDQLKNARDDVAHSGKLPEKLSGGSGQAFDLLTQAQRCLQLLLLRMLGYEGRVHKLKGGWESVVSIEKALRGEDQMKA
jgi:hypothetical protein